ncbi:MAG: Mrp/NBP35 family ATP-binding protein [Spirochaetales bacterium]|nr:Mrp/NBP35 family ATP-binding protein [Spirochaetales bacterium]
MEDRKQEQIEQEQRLKDNLSRIKNKIIVLSGKGGVGKTTVAINLAYALAMKGLHVGIMDVDIHGPNIAKMLGIEGEQLMAGPSGIEPFQVIPHLKAISIALLTRDQDAPIIWRGPLKMATIKQFISDVNWGDLDYLIVDSPPGTGDEPLSTCQLIPDINGAVIVTTPQDVAILDSRKTVLFARQLSIPIIGIIENMSGFICPHCKEKTNLFGIDGGKKAAADLNVPFLGHIPIEPEMVTYGDSGKPFIHYQKDTETGIILNEIVGKIISSESITI